ncbi:MAG: hypothetical protein V3W01_02110 [Dehalococcoidales bacterium]
MKPDEIYRETVPFTIAKWILVMEVSITILFLSLFIYQLPEGLSWFYLGMFLLFAGVTALIANFTKLTISITPRHITVAYGRISYSIPWDNVASCTIASGSGIRYGGWGIRITKLKGKWTLVYNVISSPGVVLELKRGRFGQFIFSTRHPDEVINIAKQQIG